MKATEPGVCAICGGKYSKGSRVRANQDGGGRMVHENCRRRLGKLRKAMGEEPKR